VPYIRAEVRKRWYRLNLRRKRPDQERPVQFDDFVAACLEVLWEAVKKWSRATGSMPSIEWVSLAL
jgi:hypothetical protein